MSDRLSVWAAVIGRIVFGFVFIQSAIFKIPGTAFFVGNVEASAAVGLPFPTVAVLAAFVLEAIAGVALLLGWRARLAAAALVPYVIVLTLLFHTTFTSQVDYGFFVDHLIMIAGLLYISAYGAEHFAIRKDRRS